MIIKSAKDENATEAELSCNEKWTFAHEKRNGSGTFLQRKVNFYLAVATKAELFKGEMQQKRNFFVMRNEKWTFMLYAMREKSQKVPLWLQNKGVKPKKA